MFKASEKNFELAASLRDKLKALKHIAQNNSIKIKDIKNADIFAIYMRRQNIHLWKFLEIIHPMEKSFFPDHDQFAS